MTTPAAIGSKEGLESFSSSLISKNCAGAKKSLTGLSRLVLSAQADAADREAARAGGRGLAEPGNIDVQRHDTLFDRQRTEWME